MKVNTIDAISLVFITFSSGLLFMIGLLENNRINIDWQLGLLISPLVGVIAIMLAVVISLGICYILGSHTANVESIPELTRGKQKCGRKTKQ